VRTAQRCAIGAGVLAAVVLAGCPPVDPARPPLDERDYPGELRDPSGLEGAFLLRQRIEASFISGTSRFEAVLQKQGPTLLVLGLTPFGTKAFVVTQRGAGVTAETYPGAELPFPPRFLMLDVHRAYFPPPAAGAAPVDGERTTTWAGEEVVERYQAGRIVERSFRRLDGTPPGIIRIRFGEWLPTEPSPAWIEIHQGWFGYALRIETLEQRWL
jgi:hypothetical protein